VVDVFEAVTSHRPYRGPMDRDEARELVQRDGGTHFDPEIAKTFLREERQGRILIQTEPDPVYDSFVTSVMAAQEVDVVPAGAN
jgi:HD-GYP domain-containing protein (c-di-GMP phosphodiesterase class II)